MRLLVVEDTARLAEFVAKILRQKGFAVDLVGLAKDAEAALAAHRHDGILLDFAPVVLATINSPVEVDGHRLPMGHRELALLELLLRRAGQIVKKATIEERLYGFGEEVESNAAEAHISRLRKKLAAAGSHAKIHTVRGVRTARLSHSPWIG